MIKHWNKQSLENNRNNNKNNMKNKNNKKEMKLTPRFWLARNDSRLESHKSVSSAWLSNT